MKSTLSAWCVSVICGALLACGVMADASDNASVVWASPKVNIGAGGVVHTYNTVDTLNASWTSALDYDPFLVVWCAAPGGWTANQSGSVPSSGWHLIPLNLGLTTPYPISCHLGFDDQNHHALTDSSVNSGTFNISSHPDSNPKVVGVSASSAAPTASTAAATRASAPTATTVIHEGSKSTASSGISSGAIAGIVVGVVLGITVVLGVLFFCLRRRRRNKNNNAANTKDNNSEAQGFVASEMAADEKIDRKLPAGEKPLEKDGVEQPAEMAAQATSPTGPAEMEGSTSFVERMRGTSLKR